MALGEWDGRDIIRQGVKLTRTNVVLSEALRAVPIDLHFGDTVYLVVEAQVVGCEFAPVKDTDAVQRIDVLESAIGTPVEKSAVFDFVQQQHEANVRQRDEERGQEILRLDADPLGVGGDSIEDVMRREHADGLHQRRRKACPVCAETTT